MKKTLLLILLCLSAYTASIAQSKMNFSFARNMEGKEMNVDEQVSMLIQGDVSQIEALVTEAGGKFNYSAGNNIASVSISIHQLSKIISNKAIQRVEAFPPRVQPLNDSVLRNANVLAVHSGQAPLPQAYDGTGVIVGFIDTGIDFTHPDFKDSFGKTRILWLWDQTKSNAANTPLPYGYGQEWNNTAIDAGLANSHNDSLWSGHGTHVAGVAVGNGLATGKFLGVAPKADIIFVALDFTNAANHNTIVDAVKYIYSKALATGEPCVINASIGSDYGLHDGRDLESQAMKSLINQNTGQAFIAAAGNSGNKGKFHLAYTVSATDTNFTLFAPSGGKVYMDIVADSNSLKNIQFAIGADNMAPTHSFRGNIPFTAVSSMPIQTVVTTSLFNSGGKRIGKVQSYLDVVNGDYDLQIFITPDSTTYNWRLMAKGFGSFDLWNYNPAGNSYVPIVSSVPAATFPDSIHYKYPDADKSIQGGFQCLDEVVAVGCFINRDSFPNCANNTFFDATLVVGQLRNSSSIGPTRDGRIKPDIAAAGFMVIAAAEKNVILAPSQQVNMAKGCKHVRNDGTSHSCPVVSGIAAMYLQKNPKATAMQVQQAIIRCPIKDQYTGNSLPDKYWGYGKVDGFRTLTDCITMVITTQPKDSSICKKANAAFTIAAIGTGLTYQWQVDQGAGYANLTNTAPYNGANTNTLTVSSAAIGMKGYRYRCIVKDIYSYTATSNGGILTFIPLITTNLNRDTITANQNGATYQWLDCNNGNLPISGATNQSYTATRMGDYAVIVTMNGCKDTSNCVNINHVGINQIVKNNNQLIVYPNPNNGAFIVQSTSEGVYSIINELGQTIQQFKLNSSNKYSINIENLNTGIYFIVGFNNNKMLRQKIVVTK